MPVTTGRNERSHNHSNGHRQLEEQEPMRTELLVLAALIVTAGCASGTGGRACSDQIASDDKAGRWLCSAVQAVQADEDLDEEAKTQVTTHLLQLAAEPSGRCTGATDRLLNAMRAEAGAFTDRAIQNVAHAHDRVCSPLTYHDAFWVTDIESPEGATIRNVNDMHVDAATGHVRVYAQARVRRQIVAPPQVGPGDCTEMSDGETACYHPNAVYLNGSGRELLESDGTGSWWVKHAWVLGGEGYDNCELFAREYDNCVWVEGELLEDGLSMKMAGTGEIERNFFNVRTPLLEDDPVTYRVRRFEPTNIDPQAGEVDLTPTAGFDLVWECQDDASPFDGLRRRCPMRIDR